MSFPNIVYGSEGQQFYNGASQGETRLGTQMHFADGREYVFAKAGAADLAPGKMNSSPAIGTSKTKDVAIATTNAIGDETISITNAGAAITADFYNEGYVFVNDETGEGYIYKIKDTPAESTGSATCILVLEEGSAVRTILTAGTSQVGVAAHPCSSVVVSPTTEIGVPVGVSTRVVTTLYYGWLQTKGYAAVLTNGTVVLGMAVMTSETTPGAIDPWVATGDDIPIVGHCVHVAASTEYSLIDLCIS